MKKKDKHCFVAVDIKKPPSITVGIKKNGCVLDDDFIRVGAFLFFI